MIASADRWGPFAADIDQGERVARLRCLLAIVHLITGPRGRTVVAALRAAEGDEAALPAALAEIGRLDALDRRRALASYAAITKPA